MLRLPLPMVMIGALVALLAKGDPAPQTPAVLVLIDSMSVGLLVLENKGESERFSLLGEFAMNICPLFAEEEVSQSQESPKSKLVLPLAVRMLLLARVGLVPENIQRVSLVGLSWLG